MARSARDETEEREEREGAGHDLINGAIEEGMAAIFKEHPRFKQYGQYISEHIDQRKLKSGVKRIYGYIQTEGKDWSEEKKSRFIHKNLANYVASGGIFDDKAKEVLLKGSLEEKSGRRSSSRKEVEGEKYLDEVGSAFRDLYGMMKSGDYAQRMPEFAEAVTTVYDLGFLRSAIDILDSYGLVSKGSYNAIRERIKERTEEETYKVKEVYKKMLEPKKVAAAVVSGLGLGLVAASGSGLTGNVIGASGGNAIGGVLGFVILIAGWFLYMQSRVR